MDDIKLTPEEATARLRRGGFVLCMDIPAEREIGCDCVMWQGAYPNVFKPLVKRNVK